MMAVDVQDAQSIGAVRERQHHGAAALPPKTAGPPADRSLLHRRASRHAARRENPCAAGSGFGGSGLTAAPARRLARAARAFAIDEARERHVRAVILQRRSAQWLSGAITASTKTSARLPGASVTRLSRARNGSAGWPSIATTVHRMPVDAQRHEALRCIDKTQPQRAGSCRPEYRAARSPFAVRPAGCRAEDERDILVGVGRLRSPRTISRPCRLLSGRAGCAIPECAGVRRREAVVEARAGRDRLLGERRSVHRVRHAHAVPVDRGLGRPVR